MPITFLQLQLRNHFLGVQNSGGFSPNQLPNIVAWYKADGTTHTNGSLNLIGASTQYLTTNSPWLSAPPLSVTCWINCSTPGAATVFWSLGTTNAGSVFAAVTTGGNLQVTFNSNGNSITSATSITGAWTYIGITYDGTTCNIYINGTLDANSGTLPNTFGSITIGSIGADVNGFATFNGNIDAVKIWSTTLNQTQITTDYNGGAGIAAKNNATAVGNIISGYDFDGLVNITKDYVGTTTLTNVGIATYAAGQVDSTIMTDGDAVTQWNDLSGNSNHLVPLSFNGRPTWKANVQNSLPVLRFAVSPFVNFLQATFTLAQPYEVFTSLAQSTGGATFYYAFDGVGGNNTNALVTNNSTSQWALATNAAGFVVNCFSITQATPKTVTVLYNGASTQTWLDTTSQGVITLGTSAAGGLTLGSRQDGNNGLAGDVGELFITSSVQSAPNLALAQNYLTTRWGD